MMPKCSIVLPVPPTVPSVGANHIFSSPVLWMLLLSVHRARVLSPTPLLRDFFAAARTFF